MKTLALAAIRLYQRHLSPRKGYACAWRVHRHGESCSAYGYRVIERHGLRLGMALLKRRMAACADVCRRHRGAADRRHATALQPGSQLGRQAGFCDAPGCDVPNCESPGCEATPCEMVDTSDAFCALDLSNACGYCNIPGCAQAPERPRRRPRKPRVEARHVGDPHVGNPHVGNPHVGDPHVGKPHLGKPHLGIVPNALPFEDISKK
jgi:putative component of membrane protein insertase Oxa1/YidC/SpoIIIJ protein YidD